MAYSPLPNKVRQTYNWAFILLKDAALRMGLFFNSHVIVSIPGVDYLDRLSREKGPMALNYSTPGDYSEISLIQPAEMQTTRL